jgi:hypothetical protein
VLTHRCGVVWCGAADVLLHVRDVSSAWSDAQRTDVLHVLSALGVGAAAHGKTPIPIIEVWNKTDRLTPQQLQDKLELHSQLRALGADHHKHQLVEAQAQAQAQAAEAAVAVAVAPASKSKSRVKKEQRITFHRPSAAQSEGWRQHSAQIDAITQALVPVSALHGTGLPQLLEQIDALLEAAQSNQNSAAATASGAASASASASAGAAANAAPASAPVKPVRPLMASHSVKVALDLSLPTHSRALNWLYANASVRARSAGVAAPDAMPLDSHSPQLTAALANANANANANTNPDPSASATASTAPKRKRKSSVVASKKKAAKAKDSVTEDAASATSAADAAAGAEMLVTLDVMMTAATEHEFAKLFQPHRTLSAAADDADAAGDAANARS